MSEEHSLEQLLDMQRQMDKKLLKIHKSTPTVVEQNQPCPETNEPVYDLYRVGDVLHLELELPGVEEQDILVDLTPNSLKVSGTLLASEQREKADFLVAKRPHGRFEYILNLPTLHMTTPVPPQLKNGVLILQFHAPAKTAEQD